MDEKGATPVDLLYVRTLGQVGVNGVAVAHGRAVELIAALSLAGGSLSRDWLLSSLFEQDPSPSSLPTLAMRARKLGVDVVYDSSRCMYHLRDYLTVDVTEVFAWLKRGRTAEAVAFYQGPFMPRSHSPFAVETRASLENALVRAVLAEGDVELMARIDRHVKHPELSERLIACSDDPTTVSLNRSWLKALDVV